MRAKTRTTSLDIPFIDDNRQDHGLMLSHCAGNTTHVFIDEFEMQIDIDFDEARKFAEAFVEHFGWKMNFDA